MEKKLVITASILGFLAVTLGAFGAHGLKAVLETKDLISFETGVRYQFYHTFFLLFIAHSNLFSEKKKQIIGYLILVGVIFFSGSIYILATDEFLFHKSFKSIALITPLGGLLLLAGWFLMFLTLVNKKQVSPKKD